MKTGLGMDTAEIEYSLAQIEKMTAFFSDTPKKKQKLSGQLPTLNKPKQRNANKCKKSLKDR